MNAELKRLRIWIILVPLFIYLVSFSQDALLYEYNGKQVHSAISIFLMGSIAILGGGMLEWLTWLANPIAFLATIRFLIETSTNKNHLKAKTRRISLLLSIISLAIAWSFSFWKEILAAESGSAGQIISFLSGYWLWAISMTVLSIGIFYYYSQAEKASSREF